MKRPILDEFQRYAMLKTKSTYGTHLKLHIAILHLKREIERALENTWFLNVLIKFNNWLEKKL